MSPTWRRRRAGLLVACCVALVGIGWRGRDVAAEIRADRAAQAAYARGVTMQLAGQYAEAAAAFRAAIDASPRATAAYEGLGDVEFRAGRVDEAIAAYRLLMAAYPHAYLSELHRQVGLIELKDGRLRDAARDLTETTALDPQDWLALYWLGHAYERMGDRGSALAAWRRAVALNPDYTPAQNQLRRLDGQRP